MRWAGAYLDRSRAGVARAPEPRLSDITSIHCSVTRNAGQRAGTQYPQSIENAKFSLSYMVAYSLVHGAPMISAFTEEAIRDEQVKAWQRRCRRPSIRPWAPARV